MSLTITKLGMPSENNIVARHNFIANKIIPIGIRNTDVKGTFVFLFKAIQDFDDSEKFFQIMMSTENAFYYDKVQNYHLHIQKMDDNAKKLYYENIEGITDSIVYGTDFDFIKSPELANYYQCNAVKSIDQTHAIVLDIFISSDMYIKMRLYLSMITECLLKYPASRFEYIFIDRLFHNIKILEVTNIEFNGTTQYENAINTTHYTMYCGGPKPFKMNFNTRVSEEFKNKPLSNPMDYQAYMATYSEDFFITNVILEEDGVLLIWAEYDKNKLYKNPHALKLSFELANKTNFVEDNNAIYFK